jgi:site-specific recombinase XerD
MHPFLQAHASLPLPRASMEEINFLASKSNLSEKSNFCFTDDHLAALLLQPDHNTFNSLRDYVIKLVLLDTGISGFELSQLQVFDID